MKRFRILLVSHAYEVPFYRAKADVLAAFDDVDLTLLLPDRWVGAVPGAQKKLPYRLVQLPVVFPGHIGGFFFRSGLRKLLNAIKPDLVHVEEEPWSVSAYQFARWRERLRFRYVLFSWENLRKDFHGVRGWMERRTLDAVDLGIGGNDAAARELQRKGVETVEVLPQIGLDPEWFCRKGKPGPAIFTVGYVGRFVPEKGVDLLLRAVAGLDGVWKVRLLGHGPEEQGLRALAVGLNIRDRVEFLPAVPHAEVADFLRTLDVLVLPSLTARGWAEQFGRVLIEAMATEIPVVASKSGSIPEVVGEAGVLFAEGDVSALRSVLAELRENRDWAKNLGRKGRVRVLQHFTWEKIAARTMEFYRLLLRDDPAMTKSKNTKSVDSGQR